MEMAKNQALDDGFHLFISLAQIHVPRMWVERYPGSDSEVCHVSTGVEISQNNHLSAG